MSKKPEARRITKSRPILTLEQRVDEALRIIGKVREESDFATMHRMADVNAVVDQMNRRLELWNKMKPAAAAHQKRFAEDYGVALRESYCLYGENDARLPRALASACLGDTSRDRSGVVRPRTFVTPPPVIAWDLSVLGKIEVGQEPA